MIWRNRLRELRAEKSRLDGEFTLAKLFEETGLSISYLSRLERGKSRPDPATLDKLAAVYNVDPASIEIGHDAEPQRLTNEKIAGAYVRLRRQQRGISMRTQAERYRLPVSEAFVRMVEAGQRALRDDDELSIETARAAGHDTVAELTSAAMVAFEAGELDNVLLALHGPLSRDDVVACQVAGTDEVTPAPAEVKAYVREGDYIIRLATPVLGLAVPAGAYLVARQEAALQGHPAILWIDDVPYPVLHVGDTGLQLDRAARGLATAARRMDLVTAIVFPKQANPEH